MWFRESCETWFREGDEKPMPNARLVICAANQVDQHQDHGITHLLTVANPGSNVVRPAWFAGSSLVLFFGDVVSADDAARYNTRAPTTDDLRQAVDFAAAAWSSNAGALLVHCDYGASRSPGVAYVALASWLGPGAEARALMLVEALRPEAVPNQLVVALGDALLGRNGALMAPLNKLYAALNDQIKFLE
jgi:predicted protein tyrosine phosphatase